MKAARASYLAGCTGTSNVLGGMHYGIPVYGTMAHSYVMSFADELSAFKAFARDFPDNAVLLIDTYDTLQGARHAMTVAQEMARQGHSAGPQAGLAGARERGRGTRHDRPAGGTAPAGRGAAAGPGHGRRPDDPSGFATNDANTVSGAAGRSPTGAAQPAHHAPGAGGTERPAARPAGSDVPHQRDGRRRGGAESR